MLKLDNNLLEELGLSALPDDQKRAMLQHIYETLELRVGTNLANQMTDQQLEEFEKFIDEGGDANQAQALQWLEANLPNYKEVVNQVFEELKIEIKNMAPQLVAASAQPTVMPSQSTAPTQAPVASQGYSQNPQQQPTYQQSQSYQPAATPPQPYNAPTASPLPPQSPQPYQFPAQQPPAGPGSYQQPQAPSQYPPQAV